MFQVRPELPGDAAGIRAVLVAAFPTSAEADLVEQLARDGDAAISLVALDADQIVGHVLFSRMAVEVDGRACRSLSLAPVAVLPERQRQGIGGALTEEGLQQAAATGEEIVFVLGEPAYYSRFGFRAENTAPFASPYAGPDFMARAFHTSLYGAGSAAHAVAFANLS